jgi:hypothetical protein
MPGIFDDFMNQFANGGPIDDSEVEQYQERFVSTEYEDCDFDNQTYRQSAKEYLGHLPEDEFWQAARNVVSKAEPEQWQGLLGGFLSALGGAAGGQADIARMSADDAARLMSDARREHPELLTKAVEENPWFVKALGNSVVVGVLGIAARKLARRRKAEDRRT